MTPRVVRRTVPGVLAVAIAAGPALGCRGGLETSSAPSAGTLRFVSGDRALEIPFDDDFNLVFLEVRVNGSQPRSFLLDTGFDTSVLNADRIEELGLVPLGKEAVAQPGGTVETTRLEGVRFELPGVEFGSGPIQAVPLTGLEPFVGRRVDGILGHDFVSLAVVELDYPRRVLRLYDPAGFRAAEGAVALPVTVEASEPFVDLTLVRLDGASVTGRFKIDTGSMDVAGLNRNFTDENALVAANQARVPIPGLAVGGETKGYLVRFAAMRFGPFDLPSPVIGVTTDSAGFEDRANAGTIGGDLLRRFRVTLDYAHGRMLLAPATEIGAPFEVESSGLWVVTEGMDYRRFRVRLVLPGSAAEDAGVRAGDEITALDGVPAENLRLAQIWRALRGPDGSVVRLGMRRDAETRDVALTLRPLL